MYFSRIDDDNEDEIQLTNQWTASLKRIALTQSSAKTSGADKMLRKAQCRYSSRIFCWKKPRVVDKERARPMARLIESTRQPNH